MGNATIQKVAGETPKTNQEAKGKILREFAFHLKKQGRTQGTINSYISVLNSLLAEGAYLLNRVGQGSLSPKRNMEQHDQDHEGDSLRQIRSFPRT